MWVCIDDESGFETDRSHKREFELSWGGVAFPLCCGPMGDGGTCSLLSPPDRGGSAWNVLRACDCRLLEGLLGCSRRAQQDLKLHLPLQAWSCSGMGWDRVGGLLVGGGELHCLGSSLLPEKRAWLSFLIPRKRNLPLVVFPNGAYPRSLETQERRLLTLAVPRQIGLEIMLFCVDVRLGETAEAES